jgi:hypothetical protein
MRRFIDFTEENGLKFKALLSTLGQDLKGLFLLLEILPLISASLPSVLTVAEMS